MLYSGPVYLEPPVLRPFGKCPRRLAGSSFRISCPRIAENITLQRPRSPCAFGGRPREIGAPRIPVLNKGSIPCESMGLK